MIIIRILLQTVFLAIGQIWANKVRAMLTTLGIIIGVAAVVGTVAATDGLKTYVLKEFETFGAKKVFIDGWTPRKLRGRMPWWKNELKLHEVEAIVKHCSSIDKYTPLFFGGYDMQYGELSLASAQVTGIWPAWHEIEGRYVTSGRIFTSIDEEQQRRVCLLNDKAIELLGMEKEPSGSFVLIGGKRFQVVGVVETKTVFAAFGGAESEAEVYIPLSTAMSLNPSRKHVNFLIGTLVSADKAEEAQAEVGFILRRMRNIPPGEEDTFRVQVLQQVIDQFNRIAQTITAGAGGIVAISLLVGGIGIMNIMLVSVTERTREIGLRLAIGALEREVLLQFLIEAVVLASLGGIVGIVFATAASVVLAAVMEVPYLFDAPINVLSFVFSAGIGVVFGYFPARRAAQLDPIEALRHE